MDLFPGLSHIFVVGNIDDLIAVGRPSGVKVYRLVAKAEIQALPIARPAIGIQGCDVDSPGAARFYRIVNQTPGGCRGALFEVAVPDKNRRAGRFAVSDWQEIQRAPPGVLAANGQVASVGGPIE